MTSPDALPAEGIHPFPAGFRIQVRRELTPLGSFATWQAEHAVVLGDADSVEPLSLSVRPRVSFFRVPEGRRGAFVSAFEASDEHLLGLVT